MKQIITRIVRTVLSKDSGQTIVEKKLVQEEVDTATRPYPTLPEHANPDDPPQHAEKAKYPVNFDNDVQVPPDQTDITDEPDF